ncbi:CotH kinase family protein, partial [Candidatus Latescibacterota bacterium]
MKIIFHTMLFHFLIAVCLLVNVSLGYTSEESKPLINEVMSSNITSVQDMDSELEDPVWNLNFVKEVRLIPDWIELFNPGNSPIDLTGYGLSDNSDDPFKWVFPYCILNPGYHKLVYASDENITDVPNHLETIISQGDEWRYFIGSSEPPVEWNHIEFDESEWFYGSSGFGYEDGDDATIIPQTNSLYLRKSFVIDDVRNITCCLMHIDYDDAFVAYLNGKEIARSNIGQEGTPPPYDQVALEPREARMYAGDAPELYKIENIQSFLVTGENVLAIQVHNLSIYSSDMTIIPFLTFGMNVPPPDPEGVSDVLPITVEYCLHTNFKIGSGGETITLTDRSGSECDRIETGYIPGDLSKGRKPDGGPEWVLFDQPTPGKSNITPAFQEFADIVMTVPTGGFYQGVVSLELSTNSPDAVIRYTLDGSNPIDVSFQYSSPVAISRTTIVKAQAFENGLLPGNVTTNTYFFASDFTLPVISLSLNPDDLWDEDIGIYIEGNNADPKNVYYGANYWRDWEKPVHVEFYETDGSPGFSIDAGMKIVGRSIRTYAQKPLAIFARSKYGFSEINYQLFPDLPITRFTSFVLRNSGQDWNSTLLRDGLMQSLVKDLDMDIQEYRPVIVFLNGEYWGIHNMREKLNEEYLASHHGVDPDNIDILEDRFNRPYGIVLEGDDEHYKILMEFLSTHNLRIPENYEYVKTLMDVDNFLDYMAAQIYYANTDGPGHNIKYWRPRTTDGKWRWLLFDIDLGFGNRILGGSASEAFKHNTLIYYTDPSGPDWPNPPESTFLFHKILENQNGKNDFINRISDYMNTIFSSTSVIQRIHEIKAMLEPEMPDHIARWDGSIPSMNKWYYNIQVLESFARFRTKFVRSHIQNEFNLSGTAKVSLSISQSGAGKTKLNTLLIDDYPWEGTYFQNIPIRISALPSPGYRFAGWTGITPGDSASVSVVLTGDLSVTANFEKFTGASSTIVINEINYNSSADFNTED